MLQVVLQLVDLDSCLLFLVRLRINLLVALFKLLVILRIVLLRLVKILKI